MKLIQGDALAAMADMDSNSVDLIATDPPFKVISGGSNIGANDGRPSGILAKNDGKIFKHNSIKPADYLPACYRVLKPGRDAYFMTNNLTLSSMLIAAEAAGFKFHGLLSWLKNTCTPSRWYMKDAEWIVYLYKAPARPINNPSSKQTLTFDNPRDKLHPTEKPVALFETFVTNSTKPGWTVFDPFMGSGTTGEACLKTKRDFIGVELDKEYFKTAQKRMTGFVPANDNQLDIEDAIARAA